MLPCTSKQKQAGIKKTVLGRPIAWSSFSLSPHPTISVSSSLFFRRKARLYFNDAGGCAGFARIVCPGLPMYCPAGAKRDYKYPFAIKKVSGWEGLLDLQITPIGVFYRVRVLLKVKSCPNRKFFHSFIFHSFIFSPSRHLRFIFLPARRKERLYFDDAGDCAGFARIFYPTRGCTIPINSVDGFKKQTGSFALGYQCVAPPGQSAITNTHL